MARSIPTEEEVLGWMTTLRACLKSGLCGKMLAL